MQEILQYRGYIRNWKALCRELGVESTERQEREREILVKGYAKWGEKISEHLNGSYAFVLCDPASGELFEPVPSITISRRTKGSFAAQRSEK